tara:strand:+ start:433 stop:687 length:255 start_codon:yes stop_codon:yes gene_type:complete
MASRQAFCNFLKIDPKLSNGSKDAIIAAYHKGVEVGRKGAAKDARREVIDEMRVFLGFDEANKSLSIEDWPDHEYQGTCPNCSE